MATEGAIPQRKPPDPDGLWQDPDAPPPEPEALPLDPDAPPFVPDPALRAPRSHGEDSPACGHTRLAIKRGALFAIAHSDGTIHPDCTCGQGIYAADTRYVSGLVWRLDGQPLAPLHCNADRNVFSIAHYLNEAREGLRSGTIHVEALRVLDGAVLDTITLTNHGLAALECSLELELRADFRDMFEVRGFGGVRPEGGRYALPVLERDRAWLRYLGEDGVLRETRVLFDPAPDEIEPERWPRSSETGLRATFRVRLPARGEVVLSTAIEVRATGPGALPDSGPSWSASSGTSPAPSPAASAASAPGTSPAASSVGSITSKVASRESKGDSPRFAPERETPRAISPRSLETVERLQRAALAEFASVSSTNPSFDAFLERGTLDLVSLAIPTPQGPYFAAGVPWYSCPFGRDGLITAFQALPLNPEPAIGTLRYLAARQGTRHDPSRDEEPGKILHESRAGELSLSGRVPFAPSYCTVDATPLFLVLLSETYRWTGDLGLVRELWPNALRALEWLDYYGDADGDGFVEYRRQGEKGLSNQGWKDSWDSVQHPDGSLAEGPIALVEVQGYVYDARVRMAELASILAGCGLAEPGLAARLERQAASLREAFHAAFWHAESGFLALALDGSKRQVVSPASNPGHCLWSGLLDPPVAGAVRDVLLGPGLFSRWGIRTLSAESPNYNPTSYHNGSVWPHDNALVACGLARYGYKADAAAILEGLHAAARHFPLSRLPELFCGFPRDHALAHPVPYPVACSPQAWAAGTPIMLLRAVLGIEADAPRGVLCVDRPFLPDWAGEVRLEGMRVGAGRVSLAFREYGGRTMVRVLEATGGIAVEVRS